MRTPYPGKAALVWAASLPLALLPIPLLWSLYGGWTAGFRTLSDPGHYAIPAITIGVHLAAYLATGLPIFLFKYGEPDAAVWKLPFAPALGICLGIVACTTLFAFLNYEPSLFRQPGIYLAGAAYGLITVTAAYLKRPRP